MAIGDRYTGVNWYGTFVYSGGTAVLQGDQSSFSWSAEADMVDASAGSAGYKEYIVGIKDGTATLTAMDAITSAAGSALAKATQHGTSGTLIWGPQGNLTGKPKYSVAALVKSVKVEYPYDDVVTREVEFQFSGALTTYEGTPSSVY